MPITRNPAGLRMSLAVLGLQKVPETVQELKRVYRGLAASSHPDIGGNSSAFQTLNDSYTNVLKFMKLPQRCASCKGQGKTTTMSGFQVINSRCPRCKGKGMIVLED